jgi:acyl-CoA thioester hydrolase
MRHEIPLQMRWADMDVNAHVNNVTYAAYLQEARAQLFAGAARDGGAPLLGTLVVARMRVEYLRPLVFRVEPITARTWLSAITAAKVTVECEILADDVVYCRGTTTLAPFDFAANRPRRVSPAERSALERYLDVPEAAGIPAP